MSKKNHQSGKGFGDNHKDEIPNEVSYKTLEKWHQRAINGDIDAQIKATNYSRNLFNKASYLPDSTMIHERDYEPMNCCLCGKHMPSIHDTHNPDPVTPSCTAKMAKEKNLPHRCCTECNQKILLKRIKEGKEGGCLPIMDYFNQEIPDELTENGKFNWFQL